MPKNLPYKRGIDNAILSLQEWGELLELKTKWWEEGDNAQYCKIFENEEDSDFLQIKILVEYFWCLDLAISFKEALLSEWRASLNPRALHRLAAPPRSTAPSTATSRERSQSRAVSVLRAATSFINFDEIY